MSEQTDQAIPIQESVKTSPSDRKLSRRRLLVGSVTGLVTAPFIGTQLERVVMDGFAKGLMAPGTTDSLINSAKALVETASSNENPNARPLHELIGSAVANFERRSSKKVHYKRSPDYKDKEYYSSALAKLAPTVLPKNPNDILEEFTKTIPGDAFFAYVSSHTRTTSFPFVYVSGSGLDERFKERHSELFKTGSIVRSVEALRAMEVEGKRDMDEIRNFVESRRAELGKPISSSYVLEYFLERNSGDLAASINDTAIFLKFMARSDLQTARRPSKPSDNQTWFQTNLLDEYAGSSYQNPPSGESLENLIGKPYHSWNLAAMLQFFPIEVIHVAGVYRQLSTLDTQGLNKTKADLHTLQNLRSIEKVCLKVNI